jgi:hypothetical protein
MGPLALIVAVSHHNAPATTAPATSPTQTLAASLAAIAASEFLSGQPYTIPLSSGIDPNHGQSSAQGARPIAFHYSNLLPIGLTSNTVDGLAYDSVQFLVSTPSVSYTLDLAMLITTSGPVLAAQPALLPYFGAATGTAPRLDYSSDPDVLSTIPAGLQSQVNLWATDYATGNSAGLAIVANHPGTYRTLGGFTVDGSPQIITVVNTKSGYYVRVSVLFSSDSAHGYAAETEFDLLVLPGSIPKIVAWGPPGDANLVPYSNVVS